MTELGRLERIEDLRDAWKSEGGHFTPWLAQPENLKLLGDTIGLDLELEAQEKDVGPFRADILCKDTADGSWVLVENQIESTDHTHLGQILTYAAGLKAVTVVWIAKQFTEEHRAAIDWLNEITDEKFSFFGLEIELWRIGNSPIAPKFNMICKPNDWSKTFPPRRGELTETQKLQVDFWSQFEQFVKDRTTVIRPTKPLPQQWMNFAIGTSRCHLAAVVSTWDSENETYDIGVIRGELYLGSKSAKEDYGSLLAQKEQIEKEMGEPLVWYNDENKRSCVIYLRHSADVKNRSEWPKYHEWLLTKLEMLHKVFGMRVKELS